MVLTRRVGTMTKQFGFWTLTFLVIANMIGAGVFTTSGFSLQDLGSPRLVVCAWAVGGLIALAGAFSYGMLVKAMPESGGEYLFLSRAAHPLLGFIAGWVSLIAGFSGAIAFAATALEAYIAPSGALPASLPTGSVAVLAIAAAGAFHGFKPRIGALFQNGVVLLKLALLLSILAFAAVHFPTDRWQAATPLGAQQSGWALASAFAGSLVWISLSYSGFNAAVYLASEVERADRTVPAALLAATLLVTALYVLLNAVFVYAPPPAAIAGKADVAAIAANVLGGEAFATFVRCTIAICLLTSTFSMIMAAPRVYAKMADDGLMPSWLRLHGDSPLGATALQVLLAVTLVLVSSLQGLLSYLGLTLSISTACSVACLFLPAVRRKPLWHPVHLPPAIYICCTAAAAALSVRANPWQLLGAVATFAVGAIAYFVARARAKHQSSG
jgi:APA family basic amino acid/polyamine antiporter